METEVVNTLMSQGISKSATEMGLHIAQAPHRLSPRASETLLKPQLEPGLLKIEAVLMPLV